MCSANFKCGRSTHALTASLPISLDGYAMSVD
jgi:hypothetical protein